MFPVLPDDIWRYVKRFLIYDPQVAILKRRVNTEISGSFYKYYAGHSDIEGIYRRYYYMMTPVGEKCCIDYCNLTDSV